jgi:hypothetical protein
MHAYDMRVFVNLSFVLLLLLLSKDPTEYLFQVDRDFPARLFSLFPFDDYSYTIWFHLELLVLLLVTLSTRSSH